MAPKQRGDRSPRAGQNRKKKTGAKRRKASVRQTKLIDGVTKGKSVHRAALDAGYSERMARHAGELLSTSALREAFGRYIASPEKIAQRINEGLDAVEERVIIVGRKGKEKVSIEQTVDYGERRQYAALAARLSSLDPGVKIEHGGQVDTKVIVEFVDVAAQESA
jgi:hypothetical protein